ncbi:MAG TPA: hypothetical protein VH475_21400 [Tepidisphaeraceae bacterium]
MRAGLGGIGVAAILAAAAARPAWGATNSQWVGGTDGTGLWGDPTAWDNGIVPQTATNNASVATGFATLDASYSIGGLALGGGTVGGTNDLVVNGLLSWSSGSLVDAGTTRAAAAIVFSGASDKVLGGGRMLINDGTATWVAGAIVAADGATIVNNGTFASGFDGDLRSTGTASLFLNAGTFRKTGGAGTNGGATTIGAVFNNSGTVQVQVGQLALVSGGSATGGQFDISANARLIIANDYTLDAASRISGSGSVVFAGGVNTIAGTYDVSGLTGVIGGTTTFTAPAGTAAASVVHFGPVSLSGGVLSINNQVEVPRLDQIGGNLDGNGSVTFTGPIVWQAGQQTGSGTTIASAGLSIEGPGGKSLEDRTLLVPGSASATWSGGDIRAFGSATLQNDGTFTSTFDANYIVANGSPRIVNNGLWVNSGGTGVTSIGADFFNTGTVRVDAGTLALASGSSGGRFDLAGGGVQFAGAYALTDGAVLAGTNKAVITGALDISGGTATANVVEISGNGQLTGSGLFTVDKLTWLGGRMAGGGTTLVNTSLTLDGDGKVIDGGRTLRIAASAVATWSAGDIAAFPDSVIDNAGKLETTFDGTLLYASARTAVFLNSGLFQKSAGTGTTRIDVPYINSGTTRVASGTLLLSGGGSASGNFDLADGTRLQFANDYRLADGATVTGPKVSIGLSAGTLTVDVPLAAASLEQTAGIFSGTGSVTLDKFTWSGGAMSGSATTSVNTTLLMSTSTEMDLVGRTLSIGGSATATWSAGDVHVLRGGTINNAGTFEVTQDAGLFSRFDATDAAFNNTGTLLKTGTNTALISGVPVNNTGTVHVSAGTLAISNLGNFKTTVIDAGAGGSFATVLTNTGSYNAAGSTTATIVLNTGRFTAAGSLNIAVQFTNSGIATADFLGPQTWAPGGRLLVNGGNVTLGTDGGATLTLDAKGGTTLLKSDQHLNVLNVDGGTVKLSSGGTAGAGLLLRTGGYANKGTTDNWKGKLDVTNGSLILDYQDGASPIDAVANQVRNGFNPAGAEHWTGNGIVSSTAHDNASGNTGVGYGEASDVLGATGGTFAGEDVTGNAVLVRYTLYGDATLDGGVDFNDLVKLAQNYNSGTGEKLWSQGDFTYDGIVDFNDLVKLAQNYNTTLLPPPTGAAIPGASAAFEQDLARAFAQVPEPGAGALLTACGFAGLTRRRRQRRA